MSGVISNSASANPRKPTCSAVSASAASSCCCPPPPDWLQGELRSNSTPKEQTLTLQFTSFSSKKIQKDHEIMSLYQKSLHYPLFRAESNLFNVRPVQPAMPGMLPKIRCKLKLPAILWLMGPIDRCVAGTRSYVSKGWGWSRRGIWWLDDFMIGWSDD